MPFDSSPPPCFLVLALASKQGFQAIPDRFECLADVQAGLRRAGLESSQLIIGIDATKVPGTGGAIYIANK